MRAPFPLAYAGLVKTATVDEAKAQLSGLIHDVQRGEEVYITDDGVRVAQLVAPPAEANEDEQWLARLERRGAIRRATRGPLTAEELPYFSPGAEPSGVLAALLAEREESP